MPKLHFEKFVNSPRDKVFKIFTDYVNYQSLFPQYFPSVRVLSTRNEISVIEVHMMLGKRELVMMTKHIILEQDSHEMFVIGGDAKGSHIIEQFTNYSNGTKLVVDADFKLKKGMNFFSMFDKHDIESDYSEIISECVKRVEI